jgi:hypothetical protein
VRPPPCPPRLDYYTPSRLERIARELGAEPDEFRWWLRDLVDQRSRERAAKHAKAHGQIDAKIERLNGGSSTHLRAVVGAASEQLEVVGDADERPAVAGEHDHVELAKDGVDGAALEAELA